MSKFLSCAYIRYSTNYVFIQRHFVITLRIKNNTTRSWMKWHYSRTWFRYIILPKVSSKNPLTTLSRDWEYLWFYVGINLFLILLTTGILACVKSLLIIYPNTCFSELFLGHKLKSFQSSWSYSKSDVFYVCEIYIL